MKIMPASPTPNIERKWHVAKATCMLTMTDACDDFRGQVFLCANKAVGARLWLSDHMPRPSKLPSRRQLLPHHTS